MEWKRTDEHPTMARVHDGTSWVQPPDVLVYGPNLGIHIGRVYRYRGDEIVRVSVAHIGGGECGATHYMPLPAEPN